jgi:predicted helicase
MEEVTADKSGNWLNLTNNDFDSLLSMIDKASKSSISKSKERSVFKLFGNGINTARDEWVTSLNEKELSRKVNFFLNEFSLYDAENTKYGGPIKWSRNL